MVKHKPSGVVHSGTKGGTTKCGVDTKVHAEHWAATNAQVTCNNCKR